MVKVFVKAFSTVALKEETMQSLDLFFKSFCSGVHPSKRRCRYFTAEESSEQDCKYVLGPENKPYDISLKNSLGFIADELVTGLLWMLADLWEG